ncbi:MAG: peptide chain release factor 1 [Acidobacteriota bacterium]
MLNKLKDIERTHDELTHRLAEPDVLNDPKQLRETTKAISELEPIVQLYRQFRSAQGQREDAQEMLSELPKGDELAELAEVEIRELDEQLEALEAKLQLALIPKDPNDERNVVLEIRAGTGGDEASLFAAELFRMYGRYAESKRWRTEIIQISESEVGGVKELSAIIEGQGAYSRLKFEAGVHRVQRVPQTETSGRIHTSAVTVAVLPEAEDVEIDIAEKDLRIDRYCSSGPGGQGVNTTYSAVRLTHLPTGLVVTCQDERSQIKNRAKALRVLKSRLFEIENERAKSAESQERRRMVGSGDRSEKIRTYNFPQNRVTDHRLSLTLHQLPNILEGNLDPLIEPILAQDQAQRLDEEARGGVATLTH